jgi:hypothetical protein
MWPVGPLEPLTVPRLFVPGILLYYLPNRGLGEVNFKTTIVEGK